MIQTLIDKRDTFETVRDQIAGILVSEINNQMTLATAAGKDPNLWKLRVYTERANPWETWLNAQDDESPIVNIWYDNSSFDPAASNVSERQKTDGIFNIDCYGFGKSKNEVAGGHNAGDEGAAIAVQRAFRLVRNILMASEYTYLGLRGTVWGRWPQSATVFQPQIDGRQFQNIVGARFALKATFNEFAPQYAGMNLEYVAIDIYRAGDGQVSLEMGGDLEMEGGMEMAGGPTLYAEADYDYTIPG